MNKIWILPNNDAGSQSVRRALLQNRASDTYIFDNLSRNDYLGLLNYCDAIIGNSSSGLLEAPTFSTPAVNLGRRQADRVQGLNVINAEFNEIEIKEAIKRAISNHFRDEIAHCENPYGDGNSSGRILKILEQVPVDDNLLIKKLTY